MIFYCRYHGHSLLFERNQRSDLRSWNHGGEWNYFLQRRGWWRRLVEDIQYQATSWTLATKERLNFLFNHYNKSNLCMLFLYVNEWNRELVTWNSWCFRINGDCWTSWILLFNFLVSQSLVLYYYFFFSVRVSICSSSL